MKKWEKSPGFRANHPRFGANHIIYLSNRTKAVLHQLNWHYFRINNKDKNKG